MTSTRTTAHPLTPARAARRQLVRDRMAEYLTEHGCDADRAAAYAVELLGIVDELGFTLPSAIDDPPPSAAGSTTEGRAAARALFEQTRARHVSRLVGQ